MLAVGEEMITALFVFLQNDLAPAVSDYGEKCVSAEKVGQAMA